MGLLNVDTFKGLDVLHDPARIDDKAQRELTNFDLTKQGYIQKRTGVSRWGDMDDTAALQVLGRFRTATFNFDYIITYNKTDGHLDKTDTAVGNTQTQISASVGNELECMAQYSNKAYFGVTAGQCKVYDNTTLTDLTGKYYHTLNLFFKDREWLINSKSQTTPSMLRYSEIAGSGGTDFDAANHPAANAIQVGNNDGQWLTSMIVFNDNLYLFKNQSTWVLFTDTNSPEDWTLRIVEPTIGCVSRSSPKVHENLLYFESERGIYRTDGTTFEEISLPLRSLFRERRVTNLTTYCNHAAIVNDKYMLSIHDSTGTDPDLFLVYHIKANGWTIYEFGDPAEIIPNGFVVAPDKAPDSLIFGSYGPAGYLYKYGDPDTFFDHTNQDFEYIAIVQSKLFDMGEPFAWKRMTQAAIDYVHDGEGAPVEFQWVYDTDIATTAVSTDIEDSVDPVQSGRSLYPLRPAGQFRSVGFRLFTEDIYGFQLYCISMDVEELRPVGKKIN